MFPNFFLYPPYGISRFFTFEGAAVMAGKAAEIDISPPLPGFSVSVLDVPVFRHRFMVMAALAKGLPVLFIPEQIRVAAMRLDMIYNGCRNEPAFLFASDTPGMTLQEELSGFLPLSPVAAQHCALPFALALPFMFVTILSPIWHQLRTSRILARCLRSSWHTFHPHIKKGPMASSLGPSFFLADYSISYRSQ